ncbi:DUF805 domain-containing protein [Mycoplana dimorpha]|uniref:Uncharacterized membrane protein YhaH (DUF805 family) n=1 Tax=Mycoplana dimorpha TaxID=28320 RepID=A0A2T5BEM6_MYCDI|nr:DUF805 domain-containing protein [Mycoplana dimorpha]PTM97439.1 uncharacterized membrane protein YhaH (DUF805 family) [Mycoplana dimorpha]
MADADRPPSLTWLFFGWSGRLSRLPFALAWGFWMALSAAFLTRMVMTPHEEPAFATWTLLFFAVGVVSTVSSVMLTIKRLHDMALPAPLVLCLFVPAISIFALIAFLVWPGTPGANAHGAVTDRPKG